MLVKLPKEVK